MNLIADQTRAGTLTGILGPGQNQRTIFSPEFLSNRVAQNDLLTIAQSNRSPKQGEMIRHADHSTAGSGGSASAGHASQLQANIQPSNRPVVPIISQPISKPIDLPPQYRPRKPRKQVNVACQPCRKRRSKVNISFPITIEPRRAMGICGIRHQVTDLSMCLVHGHSAMLSLRGRRQ